MGTTASTSRKAANKEMIPPWVYTVKVPPEFAGDMFGACSDGMNMVGPNTVMRHRTGHFDTDAARWSRGFTSGKHTFEIVYPMAHRGTEAAVGVGTENAPLHVKGRVTLVGHNKFSWGICLRTKRAFHKNAIVKKYPQTQVYLPDKFYMYLDADSGTLQFGSDLEYYGAAINNIPRQQPLYPMVASCVQGGTITMAYRGKGNTEFLVPGGIGPAAPVPGAPTHVITTPGPAQVMIVHTAQHPNPPPPQPYYPTGPPPYAETAEGATPLPQKSEPSGPVVSTNTAQGSVPPPPPPGDAAAGGASSPTSDTSALGPPPPCVVPAGPQMMSPNAPRNEPPPPPPPTVVSSNPEPEPEPVSQKEQTPSPKPEPESKPEPEPESKPEPESEPKSEPQAEKDPESEKAPE